MLQIRDEYIPIIQIFLEEGLKAADTRLSQSLNSLAEVKATLMFKSAILEVLSDIYDKQ